MILGITKINAFNNHQIKQSNIKYNQKEVNPAFQSLQTNKLTKPISYALAVASFFSVTSCLNKKQAGPDDVIEYNSTVVENDTMKTSIGETKYRDNRVQKHYYYFPKNDDLVYATDYDWVETVFPDGRIEKDSLGYKIYITPDGERTVVRTEENESGTKITTTFPDGTQLVRQEYKPTKKGEIIFVESKYWANGKLKERELYNEYPADSMNINGEKFKEEDKTYYNENEVLIKWESTIIDPERTQDNNKYDKQSRLIYDDLKNEKFKYKGNSKVPYQSVSIYDDCKRITLYDQKGNVKKVYFKASDGTITED